MLCVETQWTAAPATNIIRAYPRTLWEGASLGPAAAGGREIVNHKKVLGRALRAYPRAMLKGASLGPAVAGGRGSLNN